MKKKFRHLKQRQVNFLIPYYHKDIQLTIDPALIELFDRELYSKIVIFTEHVFTLIKNNALNKARALINFPEVNEIRLGYSLEKNHGKGSGIEYNEMILNMLQTNFDTFNRKEKRIEGLYWLIRGIAHDRLSDIVANILKEFLIEYTQRMSSRYNIPVERIVVKNIFDFRKKRWIENRIVSIPKNQNPSYRGQGILFVPKNFLRTLPYFNFEGLRRLCEKALKPKSAKNKEKQKYTKKDEIISLIIEKPSYIDEYMKNRKSSKMKERYLHPYDVDNDPLGKLKDC